jgi:hypothetical protein
MGLQHQLYQPPPSSTCQQADRPPATLPPRALDYDVEEPGEVQRQRPGSTRERLHQLVAPVLRLVLSLLSAFPDSSAVRLEACRWGHGAGLTCTCTAALLGGSACAPSTYAIACTVTQHDMTGITRSRAQQGSSQGYCSLQCSPYTASAQLALTSSH